jgi:hypothetical protein
MVAAIDPGLGAVVDRRSSTLLRAIEAAPKTRRWRLRAKVGRKVRWYTLPDEVVDAE